MKTDRELLELAAKAAGIGPVIGFSSAAGELMIGPRHSIRYWNPLYRDGQALRLAVKLRFKIQITDHGAAVRLGFENLSLVALDEVPDVETATRLAIVRAAAAIGEHMK